MVRVSSDSQSTELEIPHLSDQCQCCDVGDGGMRTVDCREWLHFQSMRYELHTLMLMPTLVYQQK